LQIFLETKQGPTPLMLLMQAQLSMQAQPSLDTEHPAMMRGGVASRHDAWRGTLCHVPRHVLATSADVPLNHAMSAVVPRRHGWWGSVHLPRHAW